MEDMKVKERFMILNMGERIQQTLYGCADYSVIEKKRDGIDYRVATEEEVSRGGYRKGIKYIYNGGEYFLFWETTNCTAAPFTVVVGRAVGKEIYLVCESTKDEKYKIEYRRIVNEYSKDESEDIYRHTVEVPHSGTEEFKFSSSEEDSMCIKIVKIALSAFECLMNEF